MSEFLSSASPEPSPGLSGLSARSRRVRAPAADQKDGGVDSAEPASTAELFITKDKFQKNNKTHKYVYTS